MVICFATNSALVFLNLQLVYLLDNGKPVNLDPKILSSIAHLRKTMRQLATDEERLSKDLASRRSHIKTLLRDKRYHGTPLFFL